jgi:hypothetical protein
MSVNLPILGEYKRTLPFKMDGGVANVKIVGKSIGHYFQNLDSKLRHPTVAAPPPNGAVLAGVSPCPRPIRRQLAFYGQR